MDDLEDFRLRLGDVANGLNHAQLEQLSRDIDAAAALLLDIYRHRQQNDGDPQACGSPSFDVLEAER